MCPAGMITHSHTRVTTPSSGPRGDEFAIMGSYVARTARGMASTSEPPCRLHVEGDGAHKGDRPQAAHGAAPAAAARGEGVPASSRRGFGAQPHLTMIIDWFARNSVAANLLMGLLVIGGLIASVNVTSEVMPEISLDRIYVEVPYLGAAPEEVEEAVCVRIEEAIYGIDGIKQIVSTASEGMGSVMIELELGADIRRVLDDVKGRVDAIDTFPEETGKTDHPRARRPRTGGGPGRVGLRRRVRAEGDRRARCATSWPRFPTYRWSR